jgi:hypothetical protein
VRRRLVPLLAGVVLLGAAAPGEPPDAPVAFIKVDELKKRLDAALPVDVVDVRTREEYDRLHIKPSRSIPLRSIPERLHEIPRDRLVVFY